MTRTNWREQVKVYNMSMYNLCLENKANMPVSLFVIGISLEIDLFQH